MNRRFNQILGSVVALICTIVATQAQSLNIDFLPTYANFQGAASVLVVRCQVVDEWIKQKFPKGNVTSHGCADESSYPVVVMVGRLHTPNNQRQVSANVSDQAFVLVPFLKLKLTSGEASPDYFYALTHHFMQQPESSMALTEPKRDFRFSLVTDATRKSLDPTKELKLSYSISRENKLAPIKVNTANIGDYLSLHMIQPTETGLEIFELDWLKNVKKIMPVFFEVDHFLGLDFANGTFGPTAGAIYIDSTWTKIAVR